MAAKILGQRTTTTALADLYAVPPGGETVVSSFIAVNLSSASSTLRVTVARGGAADTNAHRMIHDLMLDPGQRLRLTEGWTLSAGDVVRVSASTTTTVHLFGSEITS